MVKFKETRKQNEIQKKESNSQKRSEKKVKSFLGQNFTYLEHETYRVKLKVYKILKQIS
jgi:uncharacterized Rmd1/YagE family protein